MIQNKVVARFRDGRVLKGYTSDFVPSKSFFHLTPHDGNDGKPVMIGVGELKAVFFVKDFSGNPGYNDRKEFDAVKPVSGRKIRVLFNDGELLIGTTQGYQQGRAAFFVTPADPKSNIERCFVVTAATKEISLM